MSRYLIVNADDFGMCKSANDAVFELFREGNLLSSTIMMPCPAAKEAVEFSIANPQYAIGIHTTLTSEWKEYRWKPLTDGKSLIDDKGYMWHNSTLVEKNADSKEIEKEVRSQIDLAHSMGMKPSHIDNHMGSLYGNKTGRFGLLKLAYKICGDYGYAYRMFSKADISVLPAGTPLFALKAAAVLSKHWAKKYNVPVIDYLLFPDWGVMNKKLNLGHNDDFERDYLNYRKEILDIWTSIPEGITETFIHPALNTQELRSITGSWYQRVWEYRLMKDPYTHKFLADKGVTLISYRDLLELRK